MEGFQYERGDVFVSSCSIFNQLEMAEEGLQLIEIISWKNKAEQHV